MKFKHLTLIVAIAAAFAPHADAQTIQDMLGPWKLDIEAAGQQIPATITFTETAGVLGGNISSERGEIPLQNVSIEGDQVKWDAQLGPAELKVVVTVVENTFSGTAESPFGPVILTGRKFTPEEMAAMSSTFDRLVGDWDMRSEFNGNTFEGKLRLQVIEGRLVGSTLGGGGFTRPGDEAKQFMEFDGNVLSWEVQYPFITHNGGVAEVTISEDNTFEGAIEGELGTITLTGKLIDTSQLVLSPYDDPSPIVGTWDVVVEFEESESFAEVVISELDGELFAYIDSEAGRVEANSVEYNKIGEDMAIIRMTATIPSVSAEELIFELIVNGDTFEGEEITTGGMMYLIGEKLSNEEVSAAASEPEEPEGLTAGHIMALLDRDQSGAITPEESPEQLKQNFVMVDANADGGIDPTEAEMVAMFINAQYGAPGKSANTIIAEMMVAMLDTDGDSKISEEEAIEDLRANFGMVDANGDGGIDTAEAEVIGEFLMSQQESGSTEITAQMVIDQTDTDGDGKISMEEAPDELKANFAMVDTNADGSIDLAEAELIAMFLNSQ